MAEDTEGRKLHVSRLPRDITEGQIETIFSTYGKLQEVKILDNAGRDGAKAAFVIYEAKRGAEVAVKVLHDVYKFREDSRETIAVRYARSGGKGGGKDRDRDNDRGGRSRSYDRRGGGRGGGARGRSQDRRPRSRSPNRGGYGRDGGRGSHDRGGHGVDCDRSRDRGGKSGGKGGARRGTKLYVANLPDDIIEEALEYVFKNYGRVQDVFIMTGRSRSGQAAAFVNYAEPKAARKAILAMEQGYEIRPGEGEIVVKYAGDPRSGNKNDGRRD